MAGVTPKDMTNNMGHSTGCYNSIENFNYSWNGRYTTDPKRTRLGWITATVCMPFDNHLFIDLFPRRMPFAIVSHAIVCVGGIAMSAQWESMAFRCVSTWKFTFFKLEIECIVRYSSVLRTSPQGRYIANSTIATLVAIQFTFDFHRTWPDNANAIWQSFFGQNYRLRKSIFEAIKGSNIECQPNDCSPKELLWFMNISSKIQSKTFKNGKECFMEISDFFPFKIEFSPLSMICFTDGACKMNENWKIICNKSLFSRFSHCRSTETAFQ